MTWAVLQNLWPVFVVLIYVFFACMFKILSSHHNYELDLYKRVHEAREIRRNYIETIKARKQNLYGE